MVGSFAADAPLLEQGDRITFDIRSVQRLDRDDGNLCVRPFVDLLADAIELRDGVRV